MHFPSARDLTEDELALVDLATRTIDAATDAAPGSSEGVHTVGAALLTDDRQMVTGVNLYHFTGGPCAELVALGAARAQGAREVIAIVAVGNDARGVLAPCGRDRQVLADYHPRCRVIVPAPDGPRSVTIDDLLPGGFRGPEAVSEGETLPELSFAPQYLEAVRSGRKSRTTRRVREAERGDVMMVFETARPTTLRGAVIDVRPTVVADLTEEDARAEQCATVSELIDLLRVHYPDLRTGETVWVHEFELRDDSPARPSR